MAAGQDDTQDQGSAPDPRPSKRILNERGGALDGGTCRVGLLSRRVVLAVPGVVMASRVWGQGAAISAQEMVVAADAVRNPGQPFRATSTLTDYVGGRPRDKVVLVVFAREDKRTGQFNNVVRYVEPPRDQGKLVLYAGSALWFYDPASKAAVRISAQQRLTGQASNCDVLTINMQRDYRARLIGPEDLQDADRQKRATWHLDLTAGGPDAIYSRIEIWLEQGTYRMVKGRFYSDSGRLLKTAYYRRYAEQLGVIRPTETILIDAIDSSLVTSVVSSDMRPQDIPDAWFQRDYLPRLKID